jgi:hypothetical protein
VVPANPAASVRGPHHVVRSGKTPVPVVTERWFEAYLQDARDLRELMQLARMRPDRKQLAVEWKDDFASIKFGNYEFLIPVEIPTPAL